MDGRGRTKQEARVESNTWSHYYLISNELQFPATIPNTSQPQVTTNEPFRSAQAANQYGSGHE